MIQPNDLILFQGDSITNAFRKPEEVCNSYQLGAGYAMMVAARLLASRPEDGLRFANRGIAGEGIGGLHKRWQTDCLELKPDVLSILIGVNDAKVSHERPGLTVDDYAGRYRLLLDTTRKVLPTARLILCQPFALQAGVVRTDRLPDMAARGEIVQHLAAEFGAVLVPLQQVFSEALKQAPAEYWSFDGIHPTAQGHWLIAEAWLGAINNAR